MDSASHNCNSVIYYSFFNFTITIDFMANGESGVTNNCNMLCDQQPCHNAGTCLEDFRSNTYRCDCELTSYSGPSCTEGNLCPFNNKSDKIFAELFRTINELMRLI